MSRIVEWAVRLAFGIKKPIEYNFPKTLSEFGYQFNPDGKLCQIDPNTGELTDKGFEFEVRKGDRNYNQKHYEALGEVITEHVYKLLEEELWLTRLPVPKDFNDNEPYTTIYVTPKALAEDKPLLVLVQGSGVVRAGQWARSLIINDNMSTGTQIPYINKARELGYGVIILNTNDNVKHAGRKMLHIRGSENPEEHFIHVWNSYIKPSKCKKVAIIAHSYGGVCTVNLAWKHFPDLKDRVFAVAMTDSVHFGVPTYCEQEDLANDFLYSIGQNWRASDLPLDTPDPRKSKYKNEMLCVSAGTKSHEMTSAMAMDSVFKFIEDRRKNGPGPMPDYSAVDTVEEAVEEHAAESPDTQKKVKPDAEPDLLSHEEL